MVCICVSQGEWIIWLRALIGRVLFYRYILIMPNNNIQGKRMEATICTSCKLTIHPNFVGYHKCGYGNCPVCKTPVTKSEYWSHIKSHPGHENDSPPQPRTGYSYNKVNNNRYSLNASSNNRPPS